MTTKKLMVVVALTAMVAATFAAVANAATTVLDPGPGTDYLAYWCGGQQVNEIATGFDLAANAVTLVKVTTTCHGSGRGSPNQYYLACWTVTFEQNGSILSKVWLATYHWVQGNPAIPCPMAADPAATYTYEDGAGNFPATLSTAPIGSSSTVLRAVLETTCAPINFGTTVAGTIGTPGEQACYSFGGAAGNGVRASAVETAGSLVPVPEIRGPDGSVLPCTSSAGAVDCPLDATGLYNVVVRDSSGTETGGFDLTLTCLTPSCGTNVPHLVIGITATLTPGRVARTIAYTISVGNDGPASAASVTVTDTLPKGLFVRGLSATQGTCSQAQQTVTCAIGSLAPSTSAAVNITTVTTLSSGQVTNTACVEANNCATTTTDLP